MPVGNVHVLSGILSAEVLSAATEKRVEGKGSPPSRKAGISRWRGEMPVHAAKGHRFGRRLGAGCMMVESFRKRACRIDFNWERRPD